MSHVLEKLREAARVRWAAPPAPEIARNPALPGDVDEEPVVRLVPIASGKGGVGKTNMAVGISVSAGLRLAKMNQRVLLIDGDIGLPNTDLVLGVRPAQSVADLVEHSVEDISSLISQTRYPGLDFIAGAEEASLVLGNLYYQQRRRIIGEIKRLTASLVIFDLGASASREILDFFAMSSSGILILNPEPTSVRDGYVFLKNSFLRRVRQDLDSDPKARQWFDEIVEIRGRDAQSLATEIRAGGPPELAAAWDRTVETFQPMIIVNRVESFSEGLDTARRFIQAAQKHLSIKVHYLGSVVRDDSVWRAVKAQRPFRISEPNAPASRCIDEITARLLDNNAFDLTKNFASFGRVITARLLGRPV